MRYHGAFLLPGMALATCCASWAGIQTTINFDEPETAVPLAIRYSNRGVLLAAGARTVNLGGREFPGGRAHSGTIALVSGARGGPLTVEFTADVTHVSLYSGVPWDTGKRPVELALLAFTATGSPVGSAVARATGPSRLDVLLEVDFGRRLTGIRSIRLEARGPGGRLGPAILDDLTIDTADPVPVLAPAPPAIEVSSPGGIAGIAAGTIKIAGRISGGGLLPLWAPPRVRVTYPPSARADRPTTWDQVLTVGQGLAWVTPRDGPMYLEFAVDFPARYPGEHTLSIEAANAAGVGTREAAFTVLPSAQAVAPVARTSVADALVRPARGVVQRREVAGDADSEDWSEAFSPVVQKEYELAPGGTQSFPVQLKAATFLSVKILANGAEPGSVSAVLVDRSGNAVWTGAPAKMLTVTSQMGGILEITPDLFKRGNPFSLRLKNGGGAPLVGEVVVAARNSHE